MKKKLVSLLLAGMMITMVACSSETTESEVSTETSESVEETVETEETTEEVETSTEVEESTEEVEVDYSTVLAEGTAEDIMKAIYATADLNPDFAGAVEGFAGMPIDETNMASVLGTEEVSFVDSYVSMPMMTSIAYQAVVLKVEDGQDVEATKQLLLDNADTAKWVCVIPEAVVAESVDNTILFIMGAEAEADALVAAYQNLNATE